MSYAAPSSLLSFHLPDHDDSVAERLSWPLAGSAVIHAVVFVAFLSLRFASSLEQSSGSYEVTLVTLPAISASPTVSPAKKSKPARKAEKVPPPKTKTRKAPKAVPQRKAVTPPNPIPQEKPRVPERVTESLMGALDSVVVPKPQTPALPQQAARGRPSASAPVQQSSAVEVDVPAFKAPPQSPKLVVGKTSTPRPAPAEKVDLLAPKLKQAVDATVVPRKPQRVSKRVNPAVASERQPRRDAPKTSESPDITLPARAPRLAAVASPAVRKQETPRKTARKSSTAESLKEAIQSVRIPKRNPKNKTLPPVTQAVPLVSEPVPPARAAESRNQSLPTIVPPQAPELADVQDPVPSPATTPVTASEPDVPPRPEVDAVSVPDLLVFDPQPFSKRTESGTEERRGLGRAGFCSQKNPYWADVEEKIDDVHGKIYRYHYRVESPAILAFRVKRDGRVAGLDVVQSSGNEKFDVLAKRAVMETALPPFPAKVTKPFCRVQHKFKVNPNS